MSINKVSLPSSDKLKFSENQKWIRDISDAEATEFKSSLKRHLIVVMNDFHVEFYLRNEMLGFSYNSIKDAHLYYVKRAKGPGWISLEAKLIKTNEPLRILEIGEFSDSGLVWFLSNKIAFERYIGNSISVQDCGYDC